MLSPISGKGTWMECLPFLHAGCSINIEEHGSPVPLGFALRLLVSEASRDLSPLHRDEN
jgi:hypothetical protein